MMSPASGSTWFLFSAIAAIIVAVYYSGHGKCVLKALRLVIHGKHGCLPVPSVGNVTLHYFDVRGRGEVIRLLLEYGDIPYTEVSFDSKSWPGYKEKGTRSGLYTFGQVPAVELSSGVSLVQSQVIVHYLGRAVGLDCDCDMYHWCDTLALTTDDIRSKLSKILYDPNFSLQQRSEYLEVTLPMWLKYLEKLAPISLLQNKGLSPFVGDRITWVDFLIFDLLDINANFGFYEFGASSGAVGGVNVLQDLPKLSVYYAEFNQLPAMRRYFASQRRRPFLTPSRPVELRDVKQ